MLCMRERKWEREGGGGRGVIERERDKERDKEREREREREKVMRNIQQYAFHTVTYFPA